ncbi:hypothetical protein [Streptomyces hydrogenans]|uniref:hypothetical protein n=1 Tax=Streptomyces hydrogenans TaxID=1873719 RepID=UPI00381B0717
MVTATSAEGDVGGMCDERLSDEELEVFLQYLHRFAAHDVDIFLNLEVGDPENPVYVMFGRDYPPVGDASLYRRL